MKVVVFAGFALFPLFALAAPAPQPMPPQKAPTLNMDKPRDSGALSKNDQDTIEIAMSRVRAQITQQVEQSADQQKQIDDLVGAAACG